MASRLDRDGARLDEHTKRLGRIPVGDTAVVVAVQNPARRFPKNGVVVENQEYYGVIEMVW